MNLLVIFSEKNAFSNSSQEVKGRPSALVFRVISFTLLAFWIWLSICTQWKLCSSKQLVPQMALRKVVIIYLCFFSLPEVKWLFTNPKEVPLNMNDTPTAPLLPVGKRKRKKKQNSFKNKSFLLLFKLKHFFEAAELRNRNLLKVFLKPFSKAKIEFLFSTQQNSINLLVFWK